MQPGAMGIDPGQLRDLCGQFEQVLLTSLLPASLFTCVAVPDQHSDTDDALSSGVGPEVFREALATAIERSGGIGLGGELTHALSGGAM
jgi:hypothetical protein